MKTELILTFEIINKIGLNYNTLKEGDNIKLVPNGTFNIIKKNEEYKYFKIVKIGGINERSCVSK